MPNQFDEWIPNKQVAEILNVTTRTVFLWSIDAELNFPRPCLVKNRRYYSRAEIEAWRASRRIGAPAMPAPGPQAPGLIPPVRRAKRKAGSLIDPHAETTVEG